MDTISLEPDVQAAAPMRTAGRPWYLTGAVWQRVLAAGSVLLAWWLLSQTFADGVVPSPLVTAERLWHIVQNEDFFSTVALTLGRVAAGMVVAVVAAVVLGIAMGRSRRIELFLDMFILVGRSIPGLVWALVAVMVVGLNNAAPVVAVFLTATPLVVLQIWESTKALDPELFNMAKVFGVGPVERLRRVLLPALVPSIVAGTKLGLALAWQVVVLSELFGLGAGVGYEINESFSNFDIAGVLAWTISFAAIMAVIEYGVIGQVQRYLVRWRPKTSAS
ncbi:MAG: ABC transporter permease subunit [Propionibacteriales bacterium]|nr:ABC transporter permease subunit [Propionibacteriales bacterium]